jgi:endonuclease-3
MLKQVYTTPKWSNGRTTPFKTLIITIISQNTADRNTARAFERLSSQFEITPEALSKADANRVEDCLKVAGLYKSKTRTIRQASKIILEEYHGDLEHILSFPVEDARKILMQLPGVGPKTADVVLLFCAHKPTIPVDTHVNRVAKRLGLVDVDGGYESVRTSLQSLFDPEDYLAVHLLLISHGRRFCKALKPLCSQCPVNRLCSLRSELARDD